MNGVVIIVGLFLFFGIVLAGFAFIAYRRVLRRAKSIERGLKMVPLLIHLPPPSDDTEVGGRDARDVMRETVSQAQVLYDMIAGTAQSGFKSDFYGQRHIAFEIVASNGLVHYFAAVPIAMVSLVEQAIVTAYPGARLEEVEDHNIFNPQGQLSGTMGGELTLRHDASYPIATYETLETDPMDALLNALSKLKLGEGAAVQIMLRPASSNWVKHSKDIVAKKTKGTAGGLGITPMAVAKAVVTTPKASEDKKPHELSELERSVLQSVEQKTTHPGFEVLIRVLTSSPQAARSEMLLRDIANAFSLYEAPGLNGFQFSPARDISGLVTAFIFRFFPPEVTSSILNSPELATLFHVPNDQFASSSQLERQTSKQVDGPVELPSDGLLWGYNFFRGVKKEIRLSEVDRRRHTYIVGQTGTGKTTALSNAAVQDMIAGRGFAFIDPHGDEAERLISMVPKNRVEDIVYFNPGDTEHPLGFNLFEYKTSDQRDFLIQESISMLYKLYDPNGQGMIGPRFEHWFRMAALTLMADPNGSSFIEVPKVFSDNAYLKNKFKYLTDQTVIDFWTQEMGQTSDYHKSEMLGWFVSKFGAFQNNELMRNIIGQTKSSFDLRDIMDNNKILIVNLSKGQIGELNAKLLGMMFVIKFQAAAMSRADMAEEDRKDFSLYVDEFQNFSTDSFASILSEARKYRLNLIVGNQYIGQLSNEIREAVFGNVGTIISYRTGPEDAEFLVKQFEPIFDARDLVNLPNHNAVMRLMINGMPSSPFSISMLPPLGAPHPEMLLAVKQLSAAKFGLPKAQVEADIMGRLSNKPVAPAPPQPAAVTEPAAVVAPEPTPAPQPTPAPAASAATSTPLGAAPTPPPAPVEPAPESTPEPVAASQPEPQPAPQPEAETPAPAPEPEPVVEPAAEPKPAESTAIQATPPLPVRLEDEPHGTLSLTRLKKAGAKAHANNPDAIPPKPDLNPDHELPAHASPAPVEEPPAKPAEPTPELSLPKSAPQEESKPEPAKAEPPKEAKPQEEPKKAEHKPSKTHHAPSALPQHPIKSSKFHPAAAKIAPETTEADALSPVAAPAPAPASAADTTVQIGEDGQIINLDAPADAQASPEAPQPKPAVPSEEIAKMVEQIATGTDKPAEGSDKAKAGDKPKASGPVGEIKVNEDGQIIPS